MRDLRKVEAHPRQLGIGCSASRRSMYSIPGALSAAVRCIILSPLATASLSQ
jgi:hypothetical protein